MPKVRNPEQYILEEEQAEIDIWLYDFIYVYHYESDKENWFRYKHPNMRRSWYW